VLTEKPADGIRLQKVLAAAGVGSRRACDELIAQGRVEVGGVTVREMGVRVDPDTSVIKVDGVRVSVGTRTVHLALNKPIGVVSTMSDDKGRPSVGDYVRSRDQRLFHVGRLDADTEGLLLLTNDGDLAHRLAHPSYEVPKTYLAEVTGPIAKDVSRRLKAGIELEDGLARVDSFRLVGNSGKRVMVEIVLHEGRNRLVRRIMQEIGYPVIRLVRVQIGPVILGDLRSGKTRPLTSVEIGELYRLVDL
jgi:23S rRNA pseudouridine2605 synthase